MAYIKTVWDEATPRSLANLNKMETQYDEAVAEGVNLRKDNSKELRAEVLAGEPVSGVTGRVYYNSTTKTLNYYNGSVWVPLPGVSGQMLYDYGENEDAWVGTVDPFGPTKTFTKEADHLELAISSASGIGLVNDDTITFENDDVIVIEWELDYAGGSNALFVYARVTTDKTGSPNTATVYGYLNLSGALLTFPAATSTRPYSFRHSIISGVSMEDADYLKIYLQGQSGVGAAILKIYRIYKFPISEFLKLFPHSGA